MTSGKLRQAGSINSAVVTVESGKLKNSSGHDILYSITKGRNLKSSYECDYMWAGSMLELFQHMETQGFSEDKVKEVLASIQQEDSHWNWFRKSLICSSSEYEWFFLYAENKPQGACLIYHPKESALTKSNIFYVEFIAVAPWNRDCLIRKRELKGVGSVLLKSALKFSIEHLKLTPGFSLHSLPQSKAYYEKLKMVNVKALDKAPLTYFELPQFVAQNLLESA